MQPIGKALDKFIKAYRLKEPMATHNIAESWAVIMGPMIAKHTLKVYIRHRKLYIHVDSAALRNELEYSTTKIIELVNEHSKMNLVSEVVVC